MEVRTLIKGALNAQLASISPSLPIAWENIDFTPPAPTDPISPQKTQLVFTERAPLATDVYMVTVGDTTYTSSGTVLSEVLADLADQIVGASATVSPLGVLVQGASSGLPFSASCAVETEGGAPIESAVGSPSVVEVQTPFIGNSWLSAAFLFADPQTASLGTDGLNLVSGIYQIDVRSPLAQGWGPGCRMVDRLCSLFRRGTVLEHDGVTVTIQSSGPGPAGGEGSQWYREVVNVRFRSHVPNS